MAILHFSANIISRGKGRSAVAAAAYRSGSRITNEYDGVVHDYRRKRGVIDKQIFLPDHVPREYYDRATLWNAVEKIEKAKNAQLAREIEIAIPKEIPLAGTYQMVKEYVTENFVSKGMIADCCYHDKGDGNMHAHILLTVRPINLDGTWGDKQRKEYIFDKDGNKIYDAKKRQYKCKSIPTTDWNNRENVELWRMKWEEKCNRYLKLYGSDERVDHRSYERQGLDILPTRHLGVAASQMEKRGVKTELGNINRKIKKKNNLIKALAQKISNLTEEAMRIAYDVKKKLKDLALFLEQLRSHFICIEYVQIDNVEEQRKIKEDLIQNTEEVEKVLAIREEMDAKQELKSKYAKRSVETTSGVERLQLREAIEKLEEEVYELREMLLQSKLDAELLLEKDLKKKLKISKMCERLLSSLENQYEQLNEEKRELRAVYDTKVKAVAAEDMEELIAERQAVRDKETHRARAKLLAKYGEAFKDRFFDEAVEKVDCEIRGKVYVKREQTIESQERAKLFPEQKSR